jgi:hypothetical protein
MKPLLLITLALSGCSTVVPVTQNWPDPPAAQALQACPQKLEALPADPQLSQVAQVVSNNYTEYWQCAVKVDAWIEWYEKHKIIYKGLSQ